MTRCQKLVVVALCGLCLGGCGTSVSVPAFSAPKTPASRSSAPASSGANGEPAGSTADFFFDPERVTLTQSGTIRVDYGIRPLRYAGPLGCKGRTFAGDVTDNINFVFRYGSRDAWLGWDNGNVWHFTHRPRIGHGTITFAQRFSDGRHMRIVVHCPAPRHTGRL